MSDESVPPDLDDRLLHRSIGRRRLLTGALATVPGEGLTPSGPSSDEARTAGVDYVVSRVHCDNTSMLNINIGLGADLIDEPATDWNGFYYSCVIDVSPAAGARP